MLRWQYSDEDGYFLDICVACVVHYYKKPFLGHVFYVHSANIKNFPDKKNYSVIFNFLRLTITAVTGKFRFQPKFLQRQSKMLSVGIIPLFFTTNTICVKTNHFVNFLYHYEIKNKVNVFIYNLCIWFINQLEWQNIFLGGRATPKRKECYSNSLPISFI